MGILHIILSFAFFQFTKCTTQQFSSELYFNVGNPKINENVIISPISIQSCLALAYMGADGKTADEMAKVLKLESNDKNIVSKNFQNLLENSEKTSMLKIANKMFANKGNTIKPEYNQLAKTAFKSEADILDFSNELESVKVINDWVENKTNKKIVNLLKSVDSDTSMILVNAIYFKGDWENKFTKEITRKDDFWLGSDEKVSVDTMYNDGDYKWANITEIDSTAIEIPYADSEYSMMILLPNKRDGLKDLLVKLKDINLLDLSEKHFNYQYCVIQMPKFKIEFSISLNDPLKKMGMNEMFSDAANFNNIFELVTPVKVSEVHHKAFINVDENGSEAAASTYLKIVPLSGHINSTPFRADHPFVYAIKDKQNIYFIGHVVKF